MRRLIFALVALLATLGQSAPTQPIVKPQLSNSLPPRAAAESRTVLPEEKLATPELIRYNGYQAEVHLVITPDGYILELHRIPHGRTPPTSNATRPVILMQHGLLESSASFVFNKPSQSAGFLYADAGFDVWLGNVRGNTYGRRHLKYSPDRDRAFWKFSYDEMAKYDLQAMFDKIEQVTGQKKIFYLGHSQGTTMMFAKLADEPEFANRVRRFFALAPVARAKNIKGGMRILSDVIVPGFKGLLDFLGHGEFLPSSGVVKTLSHYVCDDNIGAGLCDNVIFLLAGNSGSSVHLNKTRTGVYLNHSPAGTSVQNAVHWSQNAHADRMQKFDFGNPFTNYKHYGQFKPPLYDLSKVRAKIHLYTSAIDVLAAPEDVNGYLIPSLPTDCIVEHEKLDTYSHLDFLWSSTGDTDIYNRVLASIRQLDAEP